LVQTCRESAPSAANLADRVTVQGKVR